ncbi:MAG: hypothetical protein PHZ00_02905 [Candidatus Peribacteraceae bacterium]|nr:hypothetical protein [Candidatus Peribacteraceae bacterium]
MSAAPFRNYSGISFVIGVGIILGVTISLQFNQFESSVGYAATSIFIPNCTDTDGGVNIGKKGHLLIGLSTEFDESCKDSSTLTEWLFGKSSG